MFSKGQSKLKKLTIQVKTGATTGPKGLPVVYGSPDSLTILSAVINFNSNHDCKGDGIDIEFKAAAKVQFWDETGPCVQHVAEQIFYVKKWDLDVTMSRPGVVAKGEYEREVLVALDSTLPSSFQHVFGSMKYTFEARLKKSKGFGITKADWLVSQEVLVLNTTLPTIYPSMSELHLNDEASLPIVKHGYWKEALPFSLTIPSRTLHLAQVMQVKVNMEPFLAQSALAGQVLSILGATFILVETRTYRAKFVSDKREVTEKVMTMAVNTGWPQSATGWERVIHVSLPSTPALSPTTKTKYIDITHCLHFSMDIQTSKNKYEKLALKVINIEGGEPYGPQDTVLFYGDPRPDGQASYPKDLEVV
ncbi:hypothetical protein BGZ94_007627 [Podila epigama]|nr:hypothetical protein BGZ94_007627 [Podila epigama]